MSDVSTIRRWIKIGEGTQLDFKSSINSPEKIARNIVAFANSRGGVLVVGVEDKGFVSGVEIEGEKYILEKTAKEYCSPAIPLRFRVYPYMDKQVLSVHIAESMYKPHKVVSPKNDTAKIYIRLGDKCVEPPSFIRNLFEKNELNPTTRTTEYYHSMQKVITFLRQHGQINVAECIELLYVSERNAERLLVDFSLEGKIKPRGQDLVQGFVLCGS
ncbi:MAG: ATP-binding protein [Chitinophagales bacterium]|nr:ATP-binding protein [Bacteroidota bacterium]MCB9042985.1 ATP-binding protein [Chitinophagales bacterium]